VRVENVEASFVLRGLVIRGATGPGGAAIRIGFASSGRVEGCTITESVNGIEIVSSTGISVRNSVLYVTGRGLRVLGETPEEYRLDIDDSNLLNDSPILYYYGLDGDTIDGKKGTHITVADSRNVTISNNEVVNGDGIELAFVTVRHRLRGGEERRPSDEPGPDRPWDPPLSLGSEYDQGEWPLEQQARRDPACPLIR